MREVVDNEGNIDKELQLHILNITKIVNMQIRKMLKPEHIEVVGILRSTRFHSSTHPFSLKHLPVFIQGLPVFIKRSLNTRPELAE
ncbi:hypothetical protein K435DRAFT_881229 [Dendrothele bispora CBS 962.96]|uniref:Uncharacterized protein n=1 Tax=Dendrothele bispora (strain CBS 962.96) TaxID=1314807 RepID=A0A4S8KIJ0_DENBC|nr:hypothetical protein K435DRAFT_881229 [Dendrothele bispora CBS 962.96]